MDFLQIWEFLQQSDQRGNHPTPPIEVERITEDGITRLLEDDVVRILE